MSTAVTVHDPRPSGFSELPRGGSYLGRGIAPDGDHFMVFALATTADAADIQIFKGLASARSTRQVPYPDVARFIDSHLRIFGAPWPTHWEHNGSRRRRTPGGRSIYYVQDEDGYIKIGVADNVKSRVSGLNTATRQSLTLLASHPGTRQSERALHERFAHLRVRGEWFRPGDDLNHHISKVAS